MSEYTYITYTGAREDIDRALYDFYRANPDYRGVVICATKGFMDEIKRGTYNREKWHQAPSA